MMTLPLGEGTPIPAVWGFSATEDSWFMEIIRADPIDRENGNRGDSDPRRHPLEWGIVQ